MVGSVQRGACRGVYYSEDKYMISLQFRRSRHAAAGRSRPLAPDGRALPACTTAADVATRVLPADQADRCHAILHEELMRNHNTGPGERQRQHILNTAACIAFEAFIVQLHYTKLDSTLHQLDSAFFCFCWQHAFFCFCCAAVGLLPAALATAQTQPLVIQGVERSTAVRPARESPDDNSARGPTNGRGKRRAPGAPKKGPGAPHKSRSARGTLRRERAALWERQLAC